MKKITLLWMGMLILTAGCSEKAEVVRYDHIDAHWQAERISSGSRETDVDAEGILKQCEASKLLSTIEGDHFTVLGMAYATRMPFIDNDAEVYAFNEVSYVEGDAVYAFCKSDQLEGYRAVALDTRPSYLKDKTGVEFPLLPTIELASQEVRDALHKPDAIYNDGQEVRPFLDTLYTISPGFNGGIEFGIGDGGVFFPYFDFGPYLAKFDSYVAIGYDISTNMPYLLLSQDGINYGMYALSDSDLVNGVDSLSVRSLSKGGKMDSMSPLSLYELTYETEGQTKTTTVSIRFKKSPLITETADTDAVSIGYVHKYMYEPGVSFNYPDAVSIRGQGYERLTEALETGTPSTKSGEAGEYMYLTLLKGNRGQQFELSYHKRSQKVDVFVKDMDTDEQFKLSSEGAKIFHELFPGAVE
ncbi:hypothetical protein EVJ27_07855 [Exiguobacterium sp. SH3S2]|uniref:hypothetical protein n=1 Tax=unclassified Exiguobacterium TaxID=2644629 RepID=UPI0010396571|nr:MULTISPECIES: hypothetical protein [unclassified Exiguobacterium]TCI45772.1 hypothetical protein EVJ28_07855 [Exiguobacterium sp. SH3S3]TCI60981.1 hypothetical protein EVJ27_07855 [Exiguobacterium sp. SH3S2]